MVRIITENATPAAPRKRRRTEEQIALDEARKEVRAATAARKLDTRRKIVLGAALMALAERDKNGVTLIEHLKKTMTERDRKLFDDA